LSKTNPNGTTVSFTYDGLNRILTKTLSTGIWNYSYDSGTNFKGRLVSEVLQPSTDGYYYDTYDAMGRVTSCRQITTALGGAQSFAMSCKYDLAGNVTSETYPSGIEYRAIYDNANRISELRRYNAGTQDRTYASLTSYAASGALAAMQLGNTKWEHFV